MLYKICPQCGAYLDPDERCDCEQDKKNAPDRTGTPIERKIMKSKAL